MTAKKTAKSNITTVFEHLRRPNSERKFVGGNVVVEFDDDNDLSFDGYVRDLNDLRGLHAWLGKLLEPAKES